MPEKMRAEVCPDFEISRATFLEHSRGNNADRMAGAEQ